MIVKALRRLDDRKVQQLIMTAEDEEDRQILERINQIYEEVKIGLRTRQVCRNQLVGG